MLSPFTARMMATRRWSMDEKQNADLARSFDRAINLLRTILIALWAIFGLLYFRS
jgi:hypothetical protein